MKLITILLFVATSVMFASCTGCSASGMRPVGPKSFKVVKVIGVDDRPNGQQYFVADTSHDGIADVELRNITAKKLQKSDSVTVVLQQGIVTNWYK